MPDRLPRILITPGEPAGIGPDLVVQLAQQVVAAELCVVADPVLLQSRARLLGLPLTLTPVDLNNRPTPNKLAELKILPVNLNVPCTPGILARENAR